MNSVVASSVCWFVGWCVDSVINSVAVVSLVDSSVGWLVSSVVSSSVVSSFVDSSFVDSSIVDSSFVVSSFVDSSACFVVLVVTPETKVILDLKKIFCTTYLIIRKLQSQCYHQP